MTVVVSCAGGEQKPTFNPRPTQNISAPRQQFRAESWLKKAVSTHRGSGHGTLHFCACVRGRRHGESVGLCRRVKGKGRNGERRMNSWKNESEPSIHPSIHSLIQLVPLNCCLLVQNHLNKQSTGGKSQEPPRLEGKRSRPPGFYCVNMLFVFVSKQETSANKRALRRL